MDLKITTPGNNSSESINVSDSTFNKDFNEPLIHQVVTAYLAGGRSGTKGQKNRSAVSGGGSKPWRQKGTGRARAGTIRSPLWRSGGKTFAATNRDFSQKVNKKMYRAALCSILSELVRQDRLIVVSGINVDTPKTKSMVAELKSLGVDNALLITDQFDENVFLSSRNLINVDYTDSSRINPVILIQHEKVVMTSGAVKKIEEMLK